MNPLSGTDFLSSPGAWTARGVEHPAGPEGGVLVTFGLDKTTQDARDVGDK